ncbi:5-oxoprolinase subunit PxpA [Flagellimonas myxillae]|uniref:5-oxoprolinase subunit PxpA n=1 Tax=Flagellimonas myxillae TaxID=2942214 RepID=UPI00201F16B1|nr:5-oxoprolinase subunit PxpA [Muricauda myxillae]MCL6265782.1 5-oxoprolinase subunit PxpA [Muricauda myxillae]
MESWEIDINCDVGEGVGNEALLFPIISSCNVACGGHAGDAESMIQVVRLAKEYKVKVGAHPSYPDKINFGRVVMSISEPALKQSILEQLQGFSTVLKSEGVTLHHIKAHGALYNESAKNEKVARLYLETLRVFGAEVPLYVPYGSVMASMAMEAGFDVHFEAFGDRNYNTDLSLVSRKQPNALIQDPVAVLNHVLPIIKTGKIVTLSGQKTDIEAQTICIHGDTPSAFQILMYLSEEFPKHRVAIRK